MVKADDKVVFEDEDLEVQTPQKFTHFELLEKEVEIIKESIDEIIEILRYNNIERKETIEPKYFDEDKVFKELEED